jgi:hypothetical protein
MSKRLWVAAVPLALLTLAGCAAKTPKGVFAGRSGPDEFVVGRAQPLVVPPDFALVPPRPGEPRPQEADSSTQALSALFGGQSKASAGEQALLQQAGAAPAPGIRSEAGSPSTQAVNKGSTTRDILNAPPTAGVEGKASTPSSGAAAPQ